MEGFFGVSAELAEVKGVEKRFAACEVYFLHSRSAEEGEAVFCGGEGEVG